MRALPAAIRCAKGEVDANLAAHLRLLAEAGPGGAEPALFPEMSLTGSAGPAAHPERLIGLGHPAITALARATGEAGVGARFGVAERSPGGEPRITQVFAAGVRLVGGIGPGRRAPPRAPPGLWIALAGQAGSTADEDFPGAWRR